jgi:hypothetical protein
MTRSLKEYAVRIDMNRIKTKTVEQRNKIHISVSDPFSDMLDFDNNQTPRIVG